MKVTPASPTIRLQSYRPFFLLLAMLPFLAAAPAPAQFSPSGGVNAPGTTVQFSWPAVPNAATYAVQVDFNAGDLGIGSPFQGFVSAPATTTTVNGLPNDGSQLFWRVVTEDGFGDPIDISAVQTFINGSAVTLGIPQPIQPEDGEVLGVKTLHFTQWTKIDRATSYIVETDTDSGFPSPTETEHFGIFGPRPDTSVAASGTTIFWRVKACRTPLDGSPQECSDFSPTFSYTIGVPTGPDIDIDPEPVRMIAVLPDDLTDSRFTDIINRGDQTLTLQSLSQSSGGDWLTFNLTDPVAGTAVTLPQDIDVGKRVRVNLESDATGLSEGEQTIILDVGSNDPDENPFPGGLEVILDVRTVPPPPPCHPADAPPFGNNDGMISGEEFNAYQTAFLNGTHSDLQGVLTAHDIVTNGGGICVNGESPCSLLNVVPDESFVCVTEDVAEAIDLTITLTNPGDAPAGTITLVKDSGAGKVNVVRESDESVVLGPDDGESADLFSELSSGSLALKVLGNETGEVQLRVQYQINTDGGTVTCPETDNTVALTVITVDLDVDSDNTNTTPDFAPDRDDTEDNIEADDTLTGRIVPFNNDDNDSDGITDLGDGFNLDMSDGSCVFSNRTYTVTGVRAGDVSRIDLGGRGFSDFSFGATPPPSVARNAPGFPADFALSGAFFFVPNVGPGNYTLNPTANCGSAPVTLTVNINVVDDYSQMVFEGPSVGAAGVNNPLGVYRVEQRLRYFGFTGTGEVPLNVDGLMSLRTVEAIKNFQAVVQHQRFNTSQGPATKSGTITKPSLDEQWLSASNAPRRTEFPASSFNPDPIAPGFRFCTSWDRQIFDLALSNRPDLIRADPGAQGNRTGMIRASPPFNTLATPSNHFYGMQSDWAMDLVNYTVGVGAINPAQPFDFTQLTDSEQNYARDIVAFVEAANTLGIPIDRILIGGRAENGIFRDVTRIKATVDAFTPSTNSVISGGLDHFHFGIRPPLIGAPKPAQNVQIN